VPNYSTVLKAYKFWIKETLFNNQNLDEYKIIGR